MKSGMLVIFAVLCAGSVVAQGRRGGARGAGGSAAQDGCISLIDITDVTGDKNYTMPAPQVTDAVKTNVKHKDAYKKFGVDGWHYFDVAYKVSNIFVDSGSKKPILVLPEVEITYALLYDITKSDSKDTKFAIANMGKAHGAVGLESTKAQYALFTETFTYADITPNREHYAAVCVTPGAAAAYGKPVVFSVQIKVNGEKQGEIMTRAMGGVKVGGKDLAGLLKEKGPDGKEVNAAWWERIQNLTDAVAKQDGVLRDRSATPFALAGDVYYDQIKTK